MDEDKNQDREGDWLMEKEAAWTRALDDVEESGTARMGKDGHEHGMEHGAWRRGRGGEGVGLGISRCLRLVKHHGVSGATKNKVAAVGISGSPDFRFGKNDERQDDSAQHAECSKHHHGHAAGRQAPSSSGPLQHLGNAERPSMVHGKTISTPDDNSPCGTDTESPRYTLILGQVGLDWAENDGYSRSSVSSPHHETWLGSRPSSSSLSSSSTETTPVDVPHIRAAHAHAPATRSSPHLQLDSHEALTAGRAAMGHSPRGIYEAPTGFHIVVMPLSPSAKHLEDWTILRAFNLSPDPE
ncbi:hypothetical protein CSOJ01_05300 [Colletotrichum sojae]|uniref:Uncharacterized protein n=1 Tax=Colletotrichum sojae TaxID=2175907 RepID=A0A8H6MXU0_9PEZI|nr:hypothetical protein CSOJ01_05300 [Colletotrichum sojae]